MKDRWSGFLAVLAFATGAGAAYALTRKRSAPIGTGIVNITSNRPDARFRVDGGEWMTPPQSLTFDLGTTHNIEWSVIADYIAEAVSSFTVTEAQQELSAAYTYSGPTATIIVHVSSIPDAGFTGGSIWMASDTLDYNALAIIQETAPAGDHAFKVPVGHYYLLGFGGVTGWARTPLPFNQRTPIVAEGDTVEFWVTYVEGGANYMWDFNLDGVVDALDDAIFAAAYDGAYDRRCDFYNDGLIGEDDLQVYLAHGGHYTPYVPSSTGTVLVSSNIASQFSIDGGAWIDCSPAAVAITVEAEITHSILFRGQLSYSTPVFNDWFISAGATLSIAAEYVPATGTATIVFHYTGVPLSAFPARSILLKQIGLDWSIPASWLNAGTPTPDVPYPVEVEAGHVYQIGFPGIAGWSWSAIPLGRPYTQLGRGCYTPILDVGEVFHIYCTWVQGLTYPMWDFNQDGIMTAADRAVFEAALGSTPASANWNRLADFNNDGIVDIEDQEVFEQHMTEGIN